MIPTPGTTRYEKLASFLEEVMTNPRASRRVRLSAAQRLDDLMRRQERKEVSEARRAERDAVAARKREREALQRETAAPSPADAAPPDATIQRVTDFLESIRQKVG
jgi:hypothetical protein